MSVVVIDLQEGFDSDTVVIKVDGAVLYQGSDVRTRYQIGLAESLKLDLAAGNHSLTISLPNRDLTAEADFATDRTSHIGINRLGDQLTIRLSDRPFLYA